LTGELAFFTAGLFAATIALFIATAGLAFFGWQQARDMKASIAASAASAKAAEDAVAVARQAIEVTQAIGRAQVRAYIAASDFSIQIDRERKPVVKFRYSNAGQSPARSITIQMDVGIGPFPVNHARTFAEIDTAPIQPASTPVVFTQTSIIYPDDLPAQSSQERTVRVNSAFSETAMVTFRKEASGCIVKGTISFDDIFNERIVEAFEYMVFSHPGHDISNFTSMARQPQSFLRKR
jgi:hypothetical protein